MVESIIEIRKLTEVTEEFPDYQEARVKVWKDPDGIFVTEALILNQFSPKRPFYPGFERGELYFVTENLNPEKPVVVTKELLELGLVTLKGLLKPY